MFLNSFIDFLRANMFEIIFSVIIVAVSITLLVLLIVNLGKHGTSKKIYIIGSIIFLLVLLSANLVIIRDYRGELAANPLTEFPIINTVLVNSLIIIIFVVLSYLLTREKSKQHEKTTVATVAILGLLTALSSVLMWFGIPIFPTMPFLKVEVSGLIYFMIFLWFGLKEASIVIVLTNIIHALMPAITPPVIPFLDELSNLVAVFIFLSPSFFALRKLGVDETPKMRVVVVSSLVGVLLTTVFMTLYNYYFNLPIVFNMSMSFSEVLKWFGSFNLIKWLVVALSVILLHNRLYDIKSKIVR